MEDEFFSNRPVVLDRIVFAHGSKSIEFEYEGATVGDGEITFHLGDKRILNT